MTVNRSEWKTAWLGAVDTPEPEGWIPLTEVSVAALAVFDQKTTIGDATKDTDPFVSSWIQGDFSGGGQIEEINEGADSNRFWWAVADTRFPNYITLPPLVTDHAVSGATASKPLGDAFDTTGVRSKVAFMFSNGSTHGVRFWNESTDTFSLAAATALFNTGGSTGFSRGTSFQGLASSHPLLYVPQGTDGYCTVHDSSGPVVTQHADSATVPAVVSFLSFNDALYALDVKGEMWVSAEGDATDWEKLLNPLGNPLRINPSETPRGLVSFYNRNGDPTLCALSSDALYMWDQEAQTLEQTTVQASGHPDFGLDATVWRPGEDLWMTDGSSAVRYTNAAVIVPNTGADRDDGLPGDNRSTTVGFAGSPSFLFMTMQSDATDADARHSLMCWTGTGWHALWERDAYQAGWVSYPHISTVDGSYRLWWSHQGTVFTSRLREFFHNPKQGFLVGQDDFAAEGYIESGRFDAAMLGFRKLASHLVVTCDYATPDETVTVEYQTDNEVAANPTAPAWIPLGTVTDAGLTRFGFNPTTVDNETFYRGVNFQWIKLRLRLARGTDTKYTPIVVAWTLHYTKIPVNATSFSFKVPLPIRTWMGRTGSEIRDHLDALLVDDEFVRFVHGSRSYRVRLAGISGIDSTGEDMQGVRQVTLMSIETGAE